MAKRQNQSLISGAGLPTTEVSAPQGNSGEQTPAQLQNFFGRFSETGTVGAGLVFVWVMMAFIAESVENAARPEGGASFFALVILILGPIVFLFFFPVLYAVSRGFDWVQAPRTALGQWLIPLVPVAAYILVMLYVLANPDNRNTVNFSAFAVFFFPLLGWRIFASAVDHRTGRCKLSALATDLTPNSVDAIVSRGDACCKSGEYDRAIRVYNSAIALDLKRADAFVGRGFAYESLGSHQWAAEDYRKAIDLNFNTAATKRAQEGLKRLEALEPSG